MITTIGMVFLIIRVRQFLGLDHLVLNTDEVGQFTACVQFARCQVCSLAIVTATARSAKAIAGFGKHGTVQPAGKSDRTTLETPQQIQ